MVPEASTMLKELNVQKGHNCHNVNYTLDRSKTS